MMHKLKWVSISIAIILAVGSVYMGVQKKMTQTVKLIPREVLFGNPEKSMARISPDGKLISYLAPDQGVLNVWVQTRGKNDDRVLTRDRDRGIRSYFWGENSDRLFYVQDVGGNENWRLYAIHLADRKVEDLTPFENVQVRLEVYNKFFPNEMILGINKDNPKLHDLYHLDIPTGKLALLAKNPGNFDGWVVDEKLTVRGGMAAADDGGFDLMLGKDSQWKKIIHWSSEEGLSNGPVGFSKDGKFIYMQDSRNANAGRLMKFSLDTYESSVIAEDPIYDVEDAMIQPDSLEVQAVSFFKARKEWKILDSTIEDDFKRISKLDRGDVSIVSRDHADHLWMVAFIKDNGPTSYYVYDRVAKEGSFLFEVRNDLKQYSLSEMEPISFESRDHLTIHGYAVFPPKSSRKNLPTVLNVHGGPWSRDQWGYDSEAQWLANRGYLALQVNYRGSTGYGKKFLNAGIKEWGRNMHNDLVDAVSWAVREGFSDPKRICIMGGSYGGYAALVGATFTPDLFSCAIDIVGPSNLITLLRSFPPYWSNAMKMFYTRVGNPNTEEAFLKSRSPLFKADQIKIPLLIAQGANDPRVKQQEAEQIVAALKKRGIPYEYMLFPDEGHGFAKPENRIKFYTHAEKFLSQHLGGTFE